MILQFIYFYMIFRSSYAYKCELPYGCRSERAFESWSSKKEDTIMCDVNNDAFEFKFKELNSSVICDNSETVKFRWTSTGLNVLDKTFNFSNAMRYFSYYDNLMIARIENVNGIDIEMFDDNLYENSNISPFYYLELENSRLDFYHNKRKLNSCQDFIDLNITQIRSIFQIQKINFYNTHLSLRKLENNRHICPLVFMNSIIEKLELVDFVDTFYKKNILQFTNETFADLNATILTLYMNRMLNINLDLNLLNPSVFEQINSISIESGSLNSIDGSIFKVFKYFTGLKIDLIILRKINNKQGIEWIKQINQGVNFDLRKNNRTEIINLIKEISLVDRLNKPMIKVSQTFPDEDFCLYIDFPFNQLVIIIYEMFNYDNTYTNLSCTFLWLVQYYDYYYNILQEDFFLPKEFISSTAFKSMSKCNFEERISLCAKSKYQVKDIWDDSDYFLFNKRTETYLKASIYPISILGMISNLIIIILILKKENMIEYKHYSYLILISIFSNMILQIYLLSWMTECFYPYHVFCPEIRKLVGMQFFKIIFKECLVSVLRFMCSFTYIAFTLNRIGLIGNDRGMMVSFFSKLAIKKYFAVTFLISCIFSWIKGFKYQVSYFEYSDADFPVSNDKNAKNGEANSFEDFYFIFNLICDLINYFVLFMICLELDLALALKTRQGVLEKAVECLNPETQDQNGMVECEIDSKKSIAMLVLNILIGVFIKLPELFIPLINVIARFYYKEPFDMRYYYKFSHPAFDVFYSTLLDTGFYYIVQDISELLLVISLPIQVFIYYNLMTKNLPKINLEITDKEN